MSIAHVTSLARRSDFTARLIPMRGRPNPYCPLSVGLWPGSPGLLPGLPFVAAAVGGGEGPAPRAGAAGRGEGFKIADLTEADVREWLARYRDSERHRAYPTT
jgi:hypothetical protein